MRAGLTLTSEDVAGLKELLWRRDIWIEQYQKMKLDKNHEIDEKNRGIRAMIESHTAEITTAKAALDAMASEQERQREILQGLVREEALLSVPVEFLRRNIRVPLTGYAVQTEMLGGVQADQ